MTCFLFMLALLAVTYWAAISDPKHQRSHSIAFVVLLLMIGVERFRAEREQPAPVVQTQPDQFTGLAQALNTAYQKGRNEWFAKQNSKPETRLSLLSQTQPQHWDRHPPQ